MTRFFLPLLLVFSVLITQAQRKQGSWQDYLSYSKTYKMAAGPDLIFCASTGGLFYYNLQDNSVAKASEMVTLSDFGIKTIAYHKTKRVLVVAYNNSNIDLISDDKVINLSDIKRKQLTADKTIHNICFIGDEAWLSCGFGIVVVNLVKQEIKETYLIGPGGSSISINDVEENNGFVYAATDNGILRAPKTGSNLADFNNWIKIDNIPFAGSKFSFLENHAGKLLANYAPGQWDGDRLFALNGNNWEAYLHEIRYAHDIQSNGKYLTVASREQVFVIDDSHKVVSVIDQYKLGNETVSPISPRSSLVLDNGLIWVADDIHSMVKISGNQYEKIMLNSPLDNSIYNLSQAGGRLWVTPGGTQGWQQPRFQRYEGNQWEYFTKSTHPVLDGFFNVLLVAENPANANHFFVSGWGGGLMEFSNNQMVNHFTNKNSPLQTALPTEPDAPYVRIAGLDFDSQGNLWVANSEVAQNLHRLTPDGKWTSFTLPEVAGKYNIGPLLINRYDDKWIIAMRGHDAYVVDKTGEKIKQLLVTSYFNNGKEEIYNRMNDIYSIAEDNEGAIWLGTSKGVAVYNNPSRIWDNNSLYAIQPSLDLNDGIYHPLLENETVTAIAVDGANRKWLGTVNSGVYLVSENGSQEILHFTTDNSALFSNTITSLAINQKNGEVFIGTDKGLISYMGEAIEGKATYDSVYVYPNPVRETYDGPVTITNLIENSEVKITDIAGNLVFRTTSLGGQAVWDGRNLNGNRVKTGVYLVFCNDELGEETHITKLLFIH